MASLAQLGVVIDSGGAKKGAGEIRQELAAVGTAAKSTAAAVASASNTVTQSFEEQVRAQQKAQAEANRLANEQRRLTNVQREHAAIAQQAAEQQAAAAAKVAEAEEKKARAIALAEVQAYKMAASMQKAAEDLGLGHHQAMMLRGSVTSLATSLTGTLGPANTLASTLASFALGNAATVGVIAGIAAIAAGYDAITAGAREATKATQEAIKASDELRKKQRQGATGDLPEQTRTLLREQAKATRELADAQRNLNELRNVGSATGAKTGVSGADQQAAALATTAAKIKDLQDRIATNQREINRVLGEANADYSRATTEQLATLVRNNAATVSEQQQLRDRLKNLQEDLRQNVSIGGDPAARARLVSDIQTIKSVYDAQGKAAAKAASEEEKWGAKVTAIFADVQRVVDESEAKQRDAVKRTQEQRDKAYASIAESIVGRQRDIDVTREQIEQLQGNANAYDALAEARAEEKAVAEARAKLPKDDTLDPEVEARIRSQVKEWYELSQALAEAKKRRDALSSWDGSDPFKIPDKTKDTRAWNDALSEVTTTLRKMSGVLNGTGSDAVKMLGAITVAVEGLMKAQKRADEMRKNNQSLSGGEQVATAAGGVVGAFGGGYAVGSMTTSKTGGALAGAATGALTGAAAGSVIPVIGTAVGAIIGGIVGGIGGLLGAANSGKQAAAQMAIAQQQLQKSLEGIRATFAGDSLSAAIAQARSQFDDLRKATEAAYSGKKNEAERNKVLAELNTLEAQRIEILKAQYAEALRLANLDLDARLAAAQGRSGEADRIREQIAAQKELNAAIDQYGKDSAYVEKLREVQAAEQAAADAARQAAEAEKKRQREAFGLDLTARRQTLNGDDRGAFITRQTIANNSALAQAQELVAAGTITAEMFEQLKTLLGDEFTKALQDFDAAAEKAKQQVQDDLAVRALVAQGRDKEAAQLRRDIANRNELANITDEAVRAQILYVQGLEAQAIATAEAAAAAQAYADKIADIDRRKIDALKVVNPELAKELEAKQVEIDRAKELAGATDDAMRARLEELYALQDQAAAMQALAENMDKATKAAQDLANFSSDLETQWLQATGKTFEASVKELNDWRETMRKNAAANGLANDPVTQQKIDDIYNAKYNKLVADTMNAATPAGSSAAGGPLDPSVRYSNDLAFNATSESTSLRLIDVALSQLTVLRSIDGKVGGANGGGVTVQITITGTPLVAQTPQELANNLATQLVPVLDEYSGRKIGVENRRLGTTALT
ncbi:MAG: hypothetical protein K2R93_12375 [Gemmatimonadaceae bacterium]|nr:hypothetical protein [Gemmatimonadaceae bacterium]